MQKPHVRRKRKNYKACKPVLSLSHDRLKGRPDTHMIRYFTALCKRKFSKLTDLELLQGAAHLFALQVEPCPCCGAHGKLVPYGDYSRYVVSVEDNMAKACSVNIKRFKCKSCRRTHALLPGNLVPYSQYSLHFMLAVLAAYYRRKTNVATICAQFNIAVSTLYSWKKRLADYRELILGMLKSLSESNCMFVAKLLSGDCLYNLLHDCFRNHGFSFMQAQASPPTLSRPP
jgi:transposase-like protein